MKNLLLITLIPMAAYAQKEIAFGKDGQPVSENEQWDTKSITETKKEKGKIIKTIEAWNAKNELKKKLTFETTDKNELLKMTDETFYPEQQAYTREEGNFKDKQLAFSTEKCLSTAGKVIYADKPCAEEPAIDEQTIREWVRDIIDTSLLEGSIKSTFTVRLNPNGTANVEKVNGEDISKVGSSLSEFEKDLIKKINKMSPEIYRGKLRKILGKEVETLIKIPVYYNVN